MELEDFALKALSENVIFSVRSLDGIYIYISPAFVRISNVDDGSQIVGTTGTQGQFNLPDDYILSFFNQRISGDDRPLTKIVWYCDCDGHFRPYIAWSFSETKLQLVFDGFTPHPADITRVVDLYLMKEDKYISGNGTIFSRPMIGTIMLYTQGHTYAHIAEILHVSPKTVSNRLDRFVKEAGFDSTNELSVYVTSAFRGAAPEYYPHDRYT